MIITIIIIYEYCTISPGFHRHCAITDSYKSQCKNWVPLKEESTRVETSVKSIVESAAVSAFSSWRSVRKMSRRHAHFRSILCDKLTQLGHAWSLLGLRRVLCYPMDSSRFVLQEQRWYWRHRALYQLTRVSYLWILPARLDVSFHRRAQELAWYEWIISLSLPRWDSGILLLLR